MADRKEHPVLWGLVALVVVAGFLGLLLGAGTLAASRMVGIGGSSGGESAGAGDTLFLPSPSPTQASSSDGATDSATDDATGGTDSSKPKKPKKKRKAETVITLTAGQTSVSPMQQIDLTGRYPSGDGAILQVQRRDGGTWVSFPVTTQVSGGSFSTYVQTGRPGPNKFRVADTAKGQFSNQVTVTVG